MSTTLMILEADKKSHLALHDWLNMAPEERVRAIADVRELAEKLSTREQHIAFRRRARALNVMASYMQFLTEEAGE